MAARGRSRSPGIRKAMVDFVHRIHQRASRKPRKRSHPRLGEPLGLTRTPEGLLRILNAIDSPWLGALMDTEISLEEPYPKLAQIAPRAVFCRPKPFWRRQWHAGSGLCPDRQHAQEVGFGGYVSNRGQGAR